MLLQNIYLPSALFKSNNNRDTVVQRPNNSINLAEWVKALMGNQGVFNGVTTNGVNLILTRVDGTTVTIPLNPLYSTVAVTNSVAGDGSTTPLSLVGDVASPAANYYYGTDETLTKTFHALVYTHTQSTASNTWSIGHNLGVYPQVTAIDNAGNEIFGDITYISPDIIEIVYSSAVSGIAYLSK